MKSATIKQPPIFKALKYNLSVGFFLALRELKRSSKWTTILIIFIMTITFLNLIVVRGILVGLIAGANISNKQYYSADIIISSPSDRTRIENSNRIITTLENLQQIKNFTTRYTASARIEAGYKEKIRADQKIDSVGGTIAGIEPEHEDSVTNLSKAVIEGQYLNDEDIDYILVGANLLKKYQAAQAPGTPILENADIGSKVLLTVNNITREVIIKGALKTKVQQVDARIFINSKVLRQLIGRKDFDVNEIAVLLNPGYQPDFVKQILIANDLNQTATIQTALEGRPQFIKDVEDTFNILGNVIGSIGLAVATISIFIVIFVNAITRRKYIGILKGIGVTQPAIELSYMFQSFFYALCGIIISNLIIFLILKSYFVQNPINFPFSNGILVADAQDVAIRAVILLVATVIAGYIPAHIVVKQHTLDAILGR